MSRAPTRLIITALVFGLLVASVSAQKAFPPPFGTITKADPAKVAKAEKGKDVWIDSGAIPDNSAIGSIPANPDLGIWDPSKNPGNPPGNPPASPPGKPGKNNSGAKHGHDHDFLTGALISQGIGLLGQLLSQGNVDQQPSFDQGHNHGNQNSDSKTIALRQRARQLIAEIDGLERAQAELRTLQQFYKKAIAVAEARGQQAQLAREHLLREFKNFLSLKYPTQNERVLMVDDLDRMTRDVNYARERHLQAREQDVDLSIQRSSLERELQLVLEAL